MRPLKNLFVFALALAACQAAAQTAFIRLSPYPSVSVADGRSTVTVTAEVRDGQGRNVPDGTQVLFSSTLGKFRESLLRTTNGIVQAVLVADSIPGTAKITATSISFGAVATVDYEFVSDRSMLSSAKEYVEIVAPGYLMFSLERRVIGAAAPNKGVHLLYRDIEIEADDLQLNIARNEVRARKARVKFGRSVREYDDIYLQLNTRRGFGTTNYRGLVPKTLVGYGRSFAFVNEERDRYGGVAITGHDIEPLRQHPGQHFFQFEDTSDSATHISARKVVVLARKEVQFHQAQIFVGGERVVRLPLFAVNLFGASPVLTEGILNVRDNQLSVNYPHYLSLKPGQTSLLRFRTGQGYGRTYGAVSGMFLDYELNWNRGDEMEGGVTVSGLLRDDWGIGVRQFMRFNERTSAFAQVEAPGRRSLFGSSSFSHQLDGWDIGLSANAMRSLRGPDFTSEQYSFVLERNPMQLGNLPVRLFYGLTASHNDTRMEINSRTQSSVGLRLRGQLAPQNVDPSTTLNASFSISHLQGHNTLQGLTLFGSLTVNRQIGRSANLNLTYDYIDDGFNSALIGRHRISGYGNLASGRTSLNLFGSKSLDFDQLSLQADASYRISGQWRLAYAHTFDQYAGSSFLDWTAMLAYRLGQRDIGLTWSKRTNRLGIQIFEVGW
jgi:hypothetical protein